MTARGSTKTAEQSGAHDSPVSLFSAVRWTPWSGPGGRGDWALLGAITVVVAFGVAMRPLRPFLIASHPILLELLDGGFAAIGAAAAFARIGEIPVSLVVLAGVVGMAKFDWLTWWAGRRWGRGLLRLFMTEERAAAYTTRIESAPRWLLWLAVVASPLPGIPSAVICALAGWARMRLVTFVSLNLTGAVIVTGAVAGIGFGLGQAAINVVLLIDRYAGYVSLALVLLALTVPFVRNRWTRWHAAR